MGRKSRAKREFRAEFQAELRRPHTLRENAKWGLGWGTGMAVLLSLFVILQSLARGSFYYEDYRISTWAVVGAYGLAGICAGILAGLLRGLAKRRAGAVLLGGVAGVLVYGVVGLALFGLDGGTAAAALVAGPVVGGLLGWRWSNPNNPPRAAREAVRRGEALSRVSQRWNASRRGR